jgi:hypothetical protein
MDERRRHSRVSVFEVAQVRFGDIARTCVVKDVSTGGAALHVTAFDQIPGRFTLSTRNYSMRECEVVWKRRCSIGVRFVVTAESDASTQEP